MKQTIIILTFLAAAMFAAGAMAKTTTARAQCAEEPRRAALETAILAVTDAYRNNDEAAMNALISPDFGIAFVYQPGAAETMTIAKGFSFADHKPNYLPYQTNIFAGRDVHFEELPEYDCYEWEWNKPPGIYCDTLHTDTKLSRIAKFENKYEMEEWTTAQIGQLEEIERGGHRIIVVGGKGEEDFTFYLSWLDGRWCLVAIDRDEKCSA